MSKNDLEKKHETFLYLWYDGRSKKFYMGKHLGIPEDSYTHSSSIWESFTKDNIPERVHRRILTYGTDEEMYILENKCLDNRKSKGEHCWKRYYNEGLGNPCFDQTGENNHNWKGGISLDKNKYAREWYKMNLEYYKEYRAQNKAKNKEWREKNITNKKEYDKKRNQIPENKEKISAQKKEYYQRKKYPILDMFSGAIL